MEENVSLLKYIPDVKGSKKQKQQKPKVAELLLLKV